MAVSLGAVAAGLLAVGTAPTQASAGAEAAKLLGTVLMPVAICFTAYAGWLFMFRRSLLKENDIYNPDLHKTGTAMLLGYLLCGALCSIFILDIFGSAIHL